MASSRAARMTAVIGATVGRPYNLRRFPKTDCTSLSRSLTRHSCESRNPEPQKYNPSTNTPAIPNPSPPVIPSNFPRYSEPLPPVIPNPPPPVIPNGVRNQKSPPTTNPNPQRNLDRHPIHPHHPYTPPAASLLSPFAVSRFFVRGEPVEPPSLGSASTIQPAIPAPLRHSCESRNPVLPNATTPNTPQQPPLRSVLPSAQETSRTPSLNPTQFLIPNF